MKQSINNFNELMKYIERPEIEFEHIQQICNETLHAYFLDNYTKHEAIKKLKEYWSVWGRIKERPLFMGIDLDNL